MNESTHFIFDNEKVIISPDLQPIVVFLQEIEKETESLLNLDKKIESIRKQYLETIDFVQFLAGKLKENSIDFSYNFSEHPQTIVEKLKVERPVRSEMIVLFAYLEVLLCLNVAYDNKTSNDDVIRRLVMNQDTIKAFIRDFCLSTDNEWGKKNKDRLKRITVDDVRKLRNSLTHFFSVGKGLAISHAYLDEKARQLEKATQFKAKFVSPEDLYEILKGSAKLIITKWSNDCKKSLAECSDDFKEKILSVRDVVASQGAMVVKNNEINI
jgi:hypothetical protein